VACKYNLPPVCRSFFHLRKLKTSIRSKLISYDSAIILIFSC
jgi:hypothetical protein